VAPGAAAEQAAALGEAGVPEAVAAAGINASRDAAANTEHAPGDQRDPSAQVAVHAVNEPRDAGPAGAQMAAALDDHRDTGASTHLAGGDGAALAVHGLGLAALGGAAARALAPQAPVDPTPDAVASVRDRIKPLMSTGAVVVSVRDHRVVVMLLCDRLFEHARPDLTEQGAQVVRDLGRVLAADRGHAYNVAIDPDRAFELVSNLAIAGLAPERIDIALKPVDRAIDVIEVEWIP
jgi:hypothetical protein